MTFDHINAAFEGGSALLIASNVRRLFKDKKLVGVNIVPTVWFSIWGFWNLFYYWGLEQWYSWALGALVFLANSTWVVFAIIYRLREASNVASSWVPCSRCEETHYHARGCPNRDQELPVSGGAK